MSFIRLATRFIGTTKRVQSTRHIHTSTILSGEWKHALSSPYYNTGTSMPRELRKQLGIHGQIPSVVESLEMQSKRALKLLRAKLSPFEKYLFMAQLRNNNTKLFYSLVNNHIEEFAPIIYTPTVGEACLNYSAIYPFLNSPAGTPDGLYITLDDLDDLDKIISDYLERTEGEIPDITVMTDGSRILGLGDLGMNGMPISMGKLQLYVAGAGIDPRRTLPIVLDFGTNSHDNQADEFYLGSRQKRPSDDVFYAAMKKVLTALTRAFPNMVVQFEDFSSAHAFGLLKEYKEKITCFNDDIQGTGAVILAGLINAFRQVEIPLDQHRIVFYGAGSAAVGVARQIGEYLQIEHGLSEKESKDMFYFIDSKGLITCDRGDEDLAQHKVYYARTDNKGQQFKSLQEIINHVKPTTLIGLSSRKNAFDKEALTRMSELNEQPIVFPLSNPSSKAECTFEEAMQATKNKVVFASGTAFPPYTIPGTNEIRTPGQGNNMYIFPGIGFGAILAKPKTITNRIVLRAAMALADTLTPQERERGLLYPELNRIREVSATIASAVVDQSVRDGLADDEMKAVHPDDYDAFVQARMWSPEIEN
ncbi:uncharacterized protein EV154DRAFT_513818 [Mucor mucedo]|uniref:uncharacterized protein n=1 Tax=Mucor mucedo TaxID=29922 RepID=UPI00221FFBBF|nr:uncharacterized protein EV154DRAFT_513818 [Mucor mucedo]KAI7889704.1 hypothetical protein EV154DRAFT_513818 [Mucor mucedo]